MKCSTCKYWNVDDKDASVSNARVFPCNKPVMFWDATEWTTKEIDDPLVGKYKADVGRTIKDEHKDLKMFVQDASDYYACLLTHEDFFCAHWEQK